MILNYNNKEYMVAKVNGQDMAVIFRVVYYDEATQKEITKEIYEDADGGEGVSQIHEFVNFFYGVNGLDKESLIENAKYFIDMFIIYHPSNARIRHNVRAWVNQAFYYAFICV